MDEPDTCGRTSPHTQTCLEALAAGWIGSTDLCPFCTRQFMAAMDGIAAPLTWHENYLSRGRLDQR